MSNHSQAPFDAPWRVTNELKRLAALPFVRLTFAVNGVKWGKGWRIFGRPIIQRYRGSTIEIGDYADFRSWPRTNPLVPMHPVVLATRSSHAVIRLGAHCGLTGSTIVAETSVWLGDRVFVGSNVTITDTDFHPLDASVRQQTPNRGETAPIIIEDDVFVGMNSLVLKGVTIGHGAVIGAGSVVTRDVPAGVIAAGNPARIIRPITT
jgi:acetyltransferase-like isoleucine patch superfamily enzyme